MTKFTRTIKIKAPIEKVFGYLTTPTNLPEFWPSFMEVKDVKPLPNGGTFFHWKYKLAGMPFEGDSDTVEFIPNKHVVAESKTGIPSKFDWVYRRENGWTELTVTSEYTIPVPLLGKLAEPQIVKLIENEVDAVLSNLKVRLEG